GLAVLLAPRGEGNAVRSVLGKSPPCVGRESEHSFLDAQLRQCVEEPNPRAVIMVGAPGVGKSRLCREFLQRVRSGGLPGLSSEVLVLTARGDALRQDRPYYLLAAALQQLCPNPGPLRSPAAQQAARFDERLRLHVPEAAQQQTCEFLSEICGLRGSAA